MSSITVNKDISYIIPQINDVFIGIIGKVVEFDANPSNVILALSNIDMQRISKFEITDILMLISHVKDKFPGYSISNELNKKVDNFIEYIYSKSFWTILSSHIDCGYYKMENRRFPYFNINDKEWFDVNYKININNDIYPAEFYGESKEEKITTSSLSERNDRWNGIKKDTIILIDTLTLSDNEEKKDTEEKIDRVVHYNPSTNKENSDYGKSNYNYIDILETQYYPNLDEYKDFILLLQKVGLINLSLKLMTILPLTYNYCHIIKKQWFWDLWNSRIYDIHLRNYIIYYSLYILKL